MKCLITRCHMHALSRNEFAYGDLYEIGDTYVLYAVKEPQVPGKWKLQTMWAPAPRGSSDRILIIDGEFFDMRSIVAVSKVHSVLNDAAKRYVFGGSTVIL